MCPEKITIKDVAASCQVSAPTVSRILNDRLDKFPVRADTIERVRRVAAEMGYIPNRFAQSLRSRRSRFIGLSIPYETLSPEEREVNLASLMNPTFSQLFYGALDAAMTHGYNIVMLPRHEVTSAPGSLRPQEIFPDILDGLLYLTPTATHSEYLDLYNNQPNMVLMGRCPMNSALPCCDIDNVQETRHLTNHLIEAGARELALALPLPESFYVMRDRVEGYRLALRDQGLSFRPELVTHNEWNDSFYQTILDLLRRQPEIDGILMGETYIHQTIQAVRDVGKRVPEDVVFACFGESEAGLYEVPPITAIEIPFFRMAYSATKMLIARIEGSQDLESRVIPARLNVRKSSQR